VEGYLITAFTLPAEFQCRALQGGGKLYGFVCVGPAVRCPRFPHGPVLRHAGGGQVGACSAGGESTGSENGAASGRTGATAVVGENRCGVIFVVICGRCDPLPGRGT
jgi:hypothetical protein